MQDYTTLYSNVYNYSMFLRKKQWYTPLVKISKNSIFYTKLYIIILYFTKFNNSLHHYASLKKIPAYFITL